MLSRRQEEVIQLSLVDVLRRSIRLLFDYPFTASYWSRITAPAELGGQKVPSTNSLLALVHHRKDSVIRSAKTRTRFLDHTDRSISNG